MALWANRDSFAITGTSISVTNASAAVVGTGTLFTTELQVGRPLVIAVGGVDVKYKIKTITSNTALTLAIPYAGTTNATLAITGGVVRGQDAPKSVPQSDINNVFFISKEEAVLPANRKKGIKGAGWWKVVESLLSNGTQRIKTECLVAMTTATAISLDALDDVIVASVNAILTIGVQPTAQNTLTGGATFGITATVAPSGTVMYQWQKALAASATKFVNVAAATSATLELSGQLVGNTGDKYRVVMTSTSGAPKVTSVAVALTFVS